MNISELIGKEIIELNLTSTNKTDVITELVELLHKDQRISNKTEFKKEIIAREDLGSTGIGFGIAIPHAKTKYVIKPSLVFGYSEKGIDYNSMDNENAHIFFMIAAPKDGANLHLQVLAKLSRKLMHKDFRESLMNIDNVDSLIAILETID